MAKKTEEDAPDKKPQPEGQTKKPRVLVVDHGSDHTENLRKMYESHPDISYDVTVKTGEEVSKLIQSDPNALKEYEIVHPSGSRTKRNLKDETTKTIFDNAEKHGYHVVATCYSAQIAADHYGVNVKRLKGYQKGKKPIRFEDGREAHIHKAHQWAIPVDEASESKLEKIATSEQTLDDGTKTHIYEIFTPKANPNVIAVQGHGEQGVGKQIMYDILSDIHKKGYKKGKT